MRVQGHPTRRRRGRPPLVEDQAWFFDTEVLVTAQRLGLRIHEVPVDWVDDLDSRVAVARTAWLDLCGVARMVRPSSRRRAAAARRTLPAPSATRPCRAAVPPRARARPGPQRRRRRRGVRRRIAALRRRRAGQHARLRHTLRRPAALGRRLRRQRGGHRGLQPRQHRRPPGDGRQCPPRPRPAPPPGRGRRPARCEPRLHHRRPGRDPGAGRRRARARARGRHRRQPGRRRLPLHHPPHLGLPPPVRHPPARGRGRSTHAPVPGPTPRPARPPRPAPDTPLRGPPDDRPPHPRRLRCGRHHRHRGGRRPRLGGHHARPADAPPPGTPVPASGTGGGRTRTPPGPGSSTAWCAGAPRTRPGCGPALLALLAATAVLYLWGLGASGWANSFYSAAVEAGTKSWKAFFFGSFDSSNFITVDKPPGPLWVMELSARLFGLNSWSMLVPQALEGVATVGFALPVRPALVLTRGGAAGRRRRWPRRRWPPSCSGSTTPTPCSPWC